MPSSWLNFNIKKRLIKRVSYGGCCGEGEMVARVKEIEWKSLFLAVDVHYFVAK